MKNTEKMQTIAPITLPEEQKLKFIRCANKLGLSLQGWVIQAGHEKAERQGEI